MTKQAIKMFFQIQNNNSYLIVTAVLWDIAQEHFHTHCSSSGLWKQLLDNFFHNYSKDWNETLYYIRAITLVTHLKQGYKHYLLEGGPVSEIIITFYFNSYCLHCAAVHVLLFVCFCGLFLFYLLHSHPNYSIMPCRTEISCKPILTESRQLHWTSFIGNVPLW